MKPSKAATNLVRLILSGNYYDINDRVLDIEFTARLIDERVKDLRDAANECVECMSMFERPRNLRPSLKPWTEPAE